MTATPPRKIKPVITDWAGTIVDYGSLAPVTVVKRVFELQGVPITDAEARQPMGRAKRDHLAAVASMPRVAALWQTIKGAPPTETDVDRLYQAFLPLQKKILSEFSRPIPGVIDAIADLRRRNIPIASTTGYTRELMDVVTAVAARDGLAIDVVIAADDVPAGRPAPWMNFRAAELLGVYPTSAILITDDTPVGIAAAKNAGARAVAVLRTGNALGIPAPTAITEPDWQRRRPALADPFLAAGADFLIDSFAHLPALIDQIERDA